MTPCGPRTYAALPHAKSSGSAAIMPPRALIAEAADRGLQPSSIVAKDPAQPAVPDLS
jgi:hypothetical protein